MSYCRFGEGSDVYMFSDGTEWECCGCKLNDGGSIGLATLTAAIEHLEKHIAAGHKVPENAIARLKAEKNTGRTIFGAVIPANQI